MLRSKGSQKLVDRAWQALPLASNGDQGLKHCPDTLRATSIVHRSTVLELAEADWPSPVPLRSLKNLGGEIVQ